MAIAIAIAAIARAIPRIPKAKDRFLCRLVLHAKARLLYVISKIWGTLKWRKPVICSETFGERMNVKREMQCKVHDRF